MPINVSKTLIKAKSLARKGDLAAAARLYSAILEEFPQNGQAARALASLGQLAAPSTPAARHALQQDLQQLVMLFNQGHLQRALEAGLALATAHPAEPLIHNVIGAVYKSLRHYEQAITSLTTAVQLKPDYAEAHNNLGTAYQDVGMVSEAIASYGRATRHAPDFFEAYYNLGSALTDDGRPEQAIASFLRAVRIKPDYAMAYGSLLFQLAQICDWDSLQKHAAVLPGLGIAGDKVYPFGMLSLEDSPPRHYQRSQNYARRTFMQRELAPCARPGLKPERLRVGYFSADFHEHATMYLMARLFELHDPDQFVVHAYSYGLPSEDSMRQRLLASVDEFHDVAHLGDKEIAELARSHDIDIAVDLKGYTQHSRPGIFAYRASPVQISYLGYPGTVAAPFMDYIIADQQVIPAGWEIHYSEQVIYLPYCYQVNDSSRAIPDTAMSRADCGLPETGFVFCCFNNNFKIGPQEFDIWMRLLQTVAGSVLWLFGSGQKARENLREQARRRGVEPDRVIFAERLSHSDHLARHRLADLFLDTFNYNAHTTASDALWAGLPVVTRPGQGFPARVAASLLHAIDLDELIAGSAGEYEQLALNLALEPGLLAAVKKKLDANRLSAPLFDTALFTRHIETAYQRVYERYVAGERPGPIVIESA